MVKLRDIKAGDELVADGGFSCLVNGEICRVRQDADGLYVRCADGHHYLIGQENENGDCVGFRRVGSDQTTA